MSVHKFCQLLIYYCVVFSYYCKKNLNSFIYLIVINSCILFLGIVSVIVFGETKFVEEACRTEKKMTLVTADNCRIPTSFSLPLGPPVICRCTGFVCRSVKGLWILMEV